MPSQIILNSIVASSIYALCALSFVLIYRTAKFFNLSHGMIIASGGYGYLFLSKIGCNEIAAIVLAVLASGCLGLALEKIFFLRLRRKKASSLVMLLVSIGILMVIQSIIAMAFSSRYIVLNAPEFLHGSFEYFGASLTAIQISIIFTWIIVFCLFVWWLKKTSVGLAVRAISNNEELSKVSGFNTDKINGLIVVASSMVSGLLGVLVGFDSGIEPAFGTDLLFKGIIVTIIGGVSNIYGCILGSFFLGTIENLAIWKLSGGWKDMISFAAMVTFLIFPPQNLFRKQITKIWNT